jgi:hypothetical protein
MELILKSNHSKKWNWFLEVLKYCPKLQNLTIHEVLLMSSYFFFFYTWTFFHLFYFIKQYLNLLQDSEYWMKLRILDKSNNFSWMPFNTSQNMFAWLQEISRFAAVAERSLILALAAHIATVLWTAAQTVANDLLAVWNRRNLYFLEEKNCVFFFFFCN